MANESPPADEVMLRNAIQFNQAISRLQQEPENCESLEWVSRWPSACCDSVYVFHLVYGIGFRGIQKVTGDASKLVKRSGPHFEQEKHVWTVVNDGLIVDLTAHQVERVGEPIVARDSTWHAKIQILHSKPWGKNDEQRYYDECFHGRFASIGRAFEEIRKEFN